MQPYSTIPLTRGLVTIVDATDYDWLSAWQWRAKPNTYGKWYAIRTVSGTGRRTCPMHRQILNAPPGLHVDHINGDGLDNRRVNLRLATVSQNQANRGAPSWNTSGVKGVYWNTPRGKWHARIWCHGEGHHLGYFERLEDAAAAYAAASRALFGEFAWQPA